MKTTEAIAVCQGWLDHLERQRVKSERLQRLAIKARKGPEQAAEAQKELRQIHASVTVYDGARLKPAVEHLMELAKEEKDDE